MDKLQMLKEELKGLNVEWRTHHRDIPEQALVNGHSIVWHEYAYTTPDDPTVEVWFKGEEEPTGYVPIKGLRAKVI